MLSREDIDILLTPSMRDAIERNIGGDPFKIAYDKRLEHSTMLATQIKYLERARTKLPSFYRARCLIPSLAFEQSSSEATAMNRRHTGKLAIDLTCGLGVDAYALSKKFETVIAVEKDPALAYLAEANFRLLGADNIHVVNMSAEQFVTSATHIHADLIYADPDRRGDKGQKLVLPQQCRPNAVELMPIMLEMADKVVLKLSPMFDVDEAFRIFGDHIRVEVVSLHGECKEVLVEIGGFADSVIAATVLGYGTIEYADEWKEKKTPPAPPDRFAYMTVPDVALAKARIDRKYFTDRGYYIEDNGGYAFTNSFPQAIPGRSFAIKSVEKFSPRTLRKTLKDMNVTRAEIHKHNFPLSTAQITKQLGISEGGTAKIAFTRAADELWALFIEDL